MKVNACPRYRGAHLDLGLLSALAHRPPPLLQTDFPGKLWALLPPRFPHWGQTPCLCWCRTALPLGSATSTFIQIPPVLCNSVGVQGLP